jgi:hypothetical protein
MSAIDDDVTELVTSIDPTLEELPPALRSARYRAIFAAAVAGPAPSRSRRRRMSVGAGVVAVAASGVLVLATLRDDPSAEAAVRDALAALDEADSWEMTGTETDGDGHIARYTARVDGDDFEVVVDGWFDGPVDDLTFTAVDDVVYITDDGRTTTMPRRPGEGTTPYPQLSAGLLAVLDDADVTEVGGDTIDGVSATRYDLVSGDRSAAAVSALGLLADLGDPDGIDRLSVWVADGQLRQLEFVGRDGRGGRVTLHDLGGDVTIRPPTADRAVADTAETA